MTGEIDINKLAVEFVNQSIDSFYQAGKDVLKGATDKVRLMLNSSYNDYLACVIPRYSKAKSFFVRSEPTYLYEFYVPIGISCGKKKVSQASISQVSAIAPHAVITGGGGSGKSMLMRHLFLDSIIAKQKVPIYLELRELNQTNQNLVSFIGETLHSNGFALDDAYIEKAMKAGHFAFLFDGFDEVSLALRKAISKQLLDLAKNYDKNLIFVSSRPDNENSVWPSFSDFKKKSLTLDQACELVQKLAFEGDLKSKFLKDLRDTLFEKHNSFLSNPLLLSIMLLTYGRSAGIPDKLNVFYNQAYEALFQGHDTVKGAFQRDRATPLDIQDFARVFSAFSIQTYDKRIFQMSKSQAIEYLEKSKTILNIEFKSSEYLQDAEQAVCLLVEDGLLITFSHRSFQEYFVARFIYHAKLDVQKKLIDKYGKTVRIDNVMNLLFEMNPELVERTLLIPGLEGLERAIKVKRRVGVTHFLRFLKFEVDSIRISSGRLEGFYLRDAEGFHAIIDFAMAHCGTLIGWTGFTSFTEIKRSFPWEKYGPKYGKSHDKTNTYTISVSKLKYTDDIVHDMALSGGFFSIRMLEQALEVKKALIKRHKSIDSSLEEILGA
jgi:hypothetical protein